MAQRISNSEGDTENQLFRFARRASVIDAIWLVALSVYILVGITSVPFHGDEAMQITMSRDYFTAFVNHNPQALSVTPPYTVDSPSWLRLINGSVNAYTLGLSVHMAGYGENDLPPVWVWPLSYDENVARGDRPTQAVLIISRISSAVFLALSAAVPILDWMAVARSMGGVSCQRVVRAQSSRAAEWAARHDGRLGTVLRTDGDPSGDLDL